MPAANATSNDAPYGVSEWAISGLYQAPCTMVKAARVKESVFSIEGRMRDLKEFEHHTKPGMSLASLAVIEATMFSVHENAVNDGLSHIDLSILRLVA
jgi:flavin reductase (DIM6/NTAB) family NADH-FMN oxidoreductase RutF